MLSCLTSCGINEQRDSLLFAQRRESATKLIARDHKFNSFFVVFVFVGCASFVVLFYRAEEILLLFHQLYLFCRFHFFF